MGKLKKKSKSTNALEIEQNDQHYKRYFNSIYENDLNINNQSKPTKENSLCFQQVNKSFKEDEPNHQLNWRRLQLSRTKLKQTSKTSALFAGFGMVVLVELQLNNVPENPIPPNLLIVFGICTILLVSIHILALMIATCILPSVESIALLENYETASDSPHERLKFFIELAWSFSSVIGVFLFLAEVIILVWVKFWELGFPNGEPGKVAALYSTIVFIPFIFVFFFFAIYFYRDFAKNKYEKSTKQIEELESIIVSLKMEHNDQPDISFGKRCKNLDNFQKKQYPALNFPNFQASSKPDKSRLFLKKNLPKYKNKNVVAFDTTNTKEYLLNETSKHQSASVDQIDKNDFKSEFKLDDLCRSKVCRNVDGSLVSGGILKKSSTVSSDCVRLSLDNVNFNTYNNIHNNIQNSTIYNRDSNLDQPPTKLTDSRTDTRTIRQQSSSSSKSINSNGTSSSTINDQQSNDSNKNLKKAEEDKKSFDSLDEVIV